MLNLYDAIMMILHHIFTISEEIILMEALYLVEVDLADAQEEQEER